MQVIFFQSINFNLKRFDCYILRTIVLSISASLALLVSDERGTIFIDAMINFLNLIYVRACRWSLLSACL